MTKCRKTYFFSATSIQVLSDIAIHLIFVRNKIGPCESSEDPSLKNKIGPCGAILRSLGFAILFLFRNKILKNFRILDFIRFLRFKISVKIGKDFQELTSNFGWVLHCFIWSAMYWKQYIDLVQYILHMCDRNYNKTLIPH